MMFFEVKVAHDRCIWSNYKLNCKNSRNNLFRSKRTTNKVLLNIFRGFKIIRNVRLMSLTPKVKVTCLSVINKEIRCTS